MGTDREKERGTAETMSKQERHSERRMHKERRREKQETDGQRQTERSRLMDMVQWSLVSSHSGEGRKAVCGFVVKMSQALYVCADINI